MDDPLIWCLILLILLVLVHRAAKARAILANDEDPDHSDALTGLLTLLLAAAGAALVYLLYGRAWYIVVPAAAGVIFLFLIFGILLPERLALLASDKDREQWKKRTGFLRVLSKPFFGLTGLLIGLIAKAKKIPPEELEDNVTEEEIIDLVKEGNEQGVLEDSEMTMISNIIELDNKEVQDIMTHRKQITAIDADEMGPKEAWAFMLDHTYSRYPLYRGDIDNILGILHLKDLARLLLEEDTGEGKPDRTLEDIARKPLYVADTQGIDDVFRQMQTKKIHMAVAVDEYGQTAGVVAMEDILEEIVGNILDEYDIDETFVAKVSENRYILKGLTTIEEMNSVLGLHVTSDEFDTVNGFLISLLGRIPEEGEEPNITYGGWHFKVMEVKDNRIQYVKVTKPPKTGRNMKMK